MNIINVNLRRMILLMILSYFVITGFDAFTELPIWAVIFYIVLLFLFWWILISYINFFHFNEEKGYIIKPLYFRRIYFSNIRKITEYVDYMGSGPYGFIGPPLFGKLYIIVLRPKTGIKIVVPFVKKKDYLGFKEIIVSKSKFKVTNEQEFVRRKSLSKAKNRKS